MIGAPQPLVLAKPAAIDTAQAARYFGARGEPDDRTMTLLETCAMPLLAAATPRAVWLEADTAALAEAGILRGGDVMKHLDLFNGLGYPEQTVRKNFSPTHKDVINSQDYDGFSRKP